MKKRGISKSEVLSCIRSPDKIERLNDLIRSIKKINEKVLVVIHRVEDKNIIIITLYRSSKISKYLTNDKYYLKNLC